MTDEQIQVEETSGSTDAQTFPIEATSRPSPTVDPLIAPSYQMDEEERRFRNRREDHRRLSRKYKPALSLDQLKELQDRVTEVSVLQDKLIDARRSLSREQDAAAKTKGTDTIKYALAEQRIAEIQQEINDLQTLSDRRSIDPVSQALLFHFQRNGLLTALDREKLRAAEEKREKKRQKRASER